MLQVLMKHDRHKSVDLSKGNDHLKSEKLFHGNNLSSTINGANCCRFYYLPPRWPSSIIWANREAHLSSPLWVNLTMSSVSVEEIECPPFFLLILPPFFILIKEIRSKVPKSLTVKVRFTVYNIWTTQLLYIAQHHMLRKDYQFYTHLL